MSKRRVTPEELELWRKVAKTTERFGPNRIVDGDPSQASNQKKGTTIATAQTKFQIGQKANGSAISHDVLFGLSSQSAQQPLKMDKKTHLRLKKGKIQPEGRIDLHGMTQSQAQPALVGFILKAHSQQKRLVLVITGKGKSTDDAGPIPVRQGVLRQMVPQWLTMPPLGPLILQVSEAQAKHGGGGAYYVYLRRQR